MQYFEPIGNSPSKKRRKVEVESEEEEEGELELSQKRMEEERAMAEYEDDDQPITVEDDEEVIIGDSKSTSKPVSKAAQNASSSSSGRLTATQKPSSKSLNPKSRTKINKGEASDAEQQCPICSKVWATDNVGLNEHIDFCLSKSAIMAATSVR